LKEQNSILGTAFILLVTLSAFNELKDGQKAEWKGTIEVENGVQVIKNPAEPIFTNNALFLEEELTIGRAEGKEGYFFTEIRSPRSTIAVDKHDRIYVLDVRECRLNVFDKTGKFLKTIGRRGQGPGEFRGPYQLLISAQDEIIVEELITRQLTYFSLEGLYKKTVSLAEAGIADINIDSTGNIYGIDIILDEKNPRWELKKFDSNLTYLATLDSAPYKSPTQADGYNPFGYGSLCFCIIINDQIVSGFSQKYELKLFGPQGDLIKKITKDYIPVKITKEEIEARTKGHISLGGPALKPSIPKYHLPFRTLMSGDEGRIFVASWEMTKDRKQRYYDIYDPAGKCISRKSFKFMPQIWKNGKLYAIEEDEEGFPYVKRFKVTWKLNY
jgi:hypothetical protein